MTGVFWPFPKEKQVRIDAKFLDPNYPEIRKRMGMSADEHPGIDINVSGTSGNADLGFPVVAMSEGEVVHVGNHRVWGQVVLIYHPTLKLLLNLDFDVYTQYAHLHQVCVEPGDWVLQGQPIGSVGRGDPAYPMFAHLHFEVRKSGPKVIPADYWPRTKDNILRHYIDPVSFINSNKKQGVASYNTLSLFLDGRLENRRGIFLANFSQKDKIFVRQLPINNFGNKS